MFDTGIISLDSQLRWIPMWKAHPNFRGTNTEGEIFTFHVSIEE